MCKCKLENKFIVIVAVIGIIVVVSNTTTDVTFITTTSTTKSKTLCNIKLHVFEHASNISKQRSNKDLVRS